MEAMGELGGADWFNLGDRDLAMHVYRTDSLARGASLSEVTNQIAGVLGIRVPILPMCEQPVSTIVNTAGGPLAFQHYFVREQCAPQVSGFAFDGIDEACPNPAVTRALRENPAAIVIAPSNPYVSVAPILAVPGMRDQLRQCGAPIVAVSPIVGGQALKGPAAKMMVELGVPATALEIARHYKGFADGLVIDETDAHLGPEIASLGMQVEIVQTVMKNLTDRIDLAKRTVDFATRLSGEINR